MQMQMVAGLVRAWFERCDDPNASTSERDASGKTTLQDKITLTAPCGGHPFVEMLDRLRIPYSVGYSGMIYLVDPEGVLDAFGHKEIALSAENEKFTLVRGDEKETLTKTKLTKLFFGPERPVRFSQDTFPLPFWQWPIEHV